MDWLWSFDQTVFRQIHIDLHRDWLDPFFWVISSTGLGWVQAILISFLLISRSSRKYVFPLAASGILAGIACNQLKHFLPRMRPSNLLDSLPQETIFGSNSYPSGHTGGSFALAFIVYFMTRRTDQAWIGTCAVAWACLVGLSRIYRGVHWPTDVMGGALVGLFCACVVYVIFETRKKTVAS